MNAHLRINEPAPSMGIPTLVAPSIRGIRAGSRLSARACTPRRDMYDRGPFDEQRTKLPVYSLLYYKYLLYIILYAAYQNSGPKSRSTKRVSLNWGGGGGRISIPAYLVVPKTFPYRFPLIWSHRRPNKRESVQRVYRFLLIWPRKTRSAKNAIIPNKRKSILYTNRLLLISSIGFFWVKTKPELHKKCHFRWKNLIFSWIKIMPKHGDFLPKNSLETQRKTKGHLNPWTAETQNSRTLELQNSRTPEL